MWLLLQTQFSIGWSYQLYKLQDARQRFVVSEVQVDLRDRGPRGRVCVDSDQRVVPRRQGPTSHWPRGPTHVTRLAQGAPCRTHGMPPALMRVVVGTWVVRRRVVVVHGHGAQCQQSLSAELYETARLSQRNFRFFVAATSGRFFSTCETVDLTNRCDPFLCTWKLPAVPPELCACTGEPAAARGKIGSRNVFGHD
jgi:hypothetical protein